MNETKDFQYGKSKTSPFIDVLLLLVILFIIAAIMTAVMLGINN